MSRTKIDITGRRIGKWTAIRRMGKAGTSFYWLVRCDCGTEKEVRLQVLRNRQSRSCGCIERGIKESQRAKCSGPIGEIYNKYKAGARKRGLVFELTREEFGELIQKPCYFTGLPPQSTFGYMKYNGLDRIDNKRGYVLDNVVPCCWIANQMKSTLGFSEFLRTCHLIAKNHPLYGEV